MSNILLLIGFFVTVLVESTFIPIPLTLVYVFIYTTMRDYENGSALFFVSGLILDLFSSRLLGTSSLFFLFVYIIFSTYKKKFHTGRLIYKLLSIVVISAIYSLLFYNLISIVKLVFLLIYSLFMMIIIEKYFLKNLRSKKINL